MCVCVCIYFYYFTYIKLNLWLTSPKAATPVNLTSATNCQIAVRWENVISIAHRQGYLYPISL